MSTEPEGMAMNQPDACPDDARLRDYSEGKLRADAFTTVAVHLRSCLKCRMQVFGGEPTIEDDGPRSFRYDTTGDTLSDSEKTNARTNYDPALHQGDEDSAVAYLFPDRQGDNLGWLGNYEIEYELGRGGMGIVFKGFDPLLRRVVAVKIMAPQLAVNERARQRFSREARAVAAINHPNVVTIHAVSEHKQVPYLVMEYVAGESLEHRIRHRRPLPPVEIVRIGAQIADGLAAAHAVGTIHRDVKPANVMLENSVDRVKISDFGLAQVALDCAELTPTDQVLGTPSYMSPEQVEGRDVDQRSDLFSLGCVIHAMVAGHSPFIGSHLLDVVRRVSDFDPPRLDEVDPNVPRPLADLVSRLLAKAPDDRPQSAEEAADALRALLTDGSFDSSRRLAPLLSSSMGLVARGTSRLRTVGLMLGLVAAASSLGWWYSRHGSTTGEASTAPANPFLVTVAQAGPADYTDLREAVSKAKPGATIRILDDGRYEGPISIAPPQRLGGLTIESTRGATLFAPDDHIIVFEVRNTPNITVRGLKIACALEQHGLVFYKDVSGAVLEKIQIDQPAASRRAAVYLTNGTHGSPEKPLILRGLDVTAGKLGVALGAEDPGAAISSVRIERSRVHGSGLIFILEHDIHDLTISECILTDGETGVYMDITDDDPVADVRIRNNTFFDLACWISLGKSRDDLKNLSIARNLILDCESVDPSSHDPSVVGPRWFKDNVWRTKRPEVAGPFARAVAEVPLVSTDPESPDFLRPADPASVALKDGPAGESGFAGAVPPGRDPSTTPP